MCQVISKDGHFRKTHMKVKNDVFSPGVSFTRDMVVPLYMKELTKARISKLKESVGNE